MVAMCSSCTAFVFVLIALTAAVCGYFKCFHLIGNDWGLLKSLLCNIKTKKCKNAYIPVSILLKGDMLPEIFEILSYIFYWATEGLGAGSKVL